jgi:hypothetical protein
MDKNFLEFWGNFLLSVAKGQRQLEEFSRWMSEGMSGFRDLNLLFQQIYGLGSECPEGDKGWKAARAAFDDAYRAYLGVLGAVSKSDYQALQNQLEELRQKTEEQEAALRKLRGELGECRMAHGDVVRGFQELIQVQSEQFQELTESFNRFFTGRGKDPS